VATTRVIDALEDLRREAEWDRDHFWPDGILVNGVDRWYERRAVIRAINAARQARERDEPAVIEDPTPQDIAAIEEDLAHAPS
jgi:hypothetical protein